MPVTRASTTPLGLDSDLTVSALGVGCWAIGGPWTDGQRGQAGWGEVDDAESVASPPRCDRRWRHVLRHGYENYGAGHSEVVLGRAIAGGRDDVVLATKFGYVVRRGQPARRRFVDVTPRRSVRGSLTDSLDAASARTGSTCSSSHVGDLEPDITAEDVRSTLEALVGQGQDPCLRLGAPTRTAIAPPCSRPGPKLRLRPAPGSNVLEDNPAMLTLCERENLASINRGPLGHGHPHRCLRLGAGAAAVDRRPHVRRRLAERTSSMASPTREVAGRAPRRSVRVLTSGGRTPAQGALAWIWGRSAASRSQSRGCGRWLRPRRTPPLSTTGRSHPTPCARSRSCSHAALADLGRHPAT